MKLSDLMIGQTGVVQGFDLSKQVLQRLQKMGITTGVKITLIRRAPLFEPLEYCVRGVYLALRKSEADKIFVKV